MKENLTPRDAFNYSINRMAEAHDTPTGGPPSGASGRPPQGTEGGREARGARTQGTPEQMEAARSYYDPIIARTTDPDEREMFVALREMGVPPIRGGAMAPVEPEAPPFEQRFQEMRQALSGYGHYRMTLSLLERESIDTNLLRQAYVNDGRAANDRLDAVTRELGGLDARDLRRGDLERERDALLVASPGITDLVGEKLGIGRGETPPEVVPILEKVNRGEELTDRDREVMNNQIEQLNIATGGSDEGTIQVIASDEDFSQKYLDKILSLPELLPREQYSLGFYERMNLELFLHRVREIDEGRASKNAMPADQALDRLRRYSDQRGMRQSFHEMRRYMVIGNIRDFAEIARTIAPEYLQRSAQYRAVPTVQRLYDTAFKEVMARKQTIEPKDFEDIDKQVDQRLRKMSTAGLFGRILEQWEITRALAVGKNYSVISLRIPELISIGRIQSLATTTSAISKTFASFDYESVTRFLNPLRWLGSRFDMGEVHGGQEYLEEVYRGIDEALHDPKKPQDIPRLAKIFGLNRVTLERSAPFSQASIDSGWRTVEAYLNSFKVRAKVRSEWITDPMDNERYEIKVYDPNGEEEDVDAGYYFNWQNQWNHDERSAGFDINLAYEELIKQVPFYRGLMAKDAPSSSNKKLDASETKIKLWKLIARDMPGQIMLILSGDEQFEAIKGDYFTTQDVEGGDVFNEAAYKTLQEKLALHQEKRVRDQMGEDKRVKEAREKGETTERKIIRLDLDAEIGDFTLTDREKGFIRKLVQTDNEGNVTGGLIVDKASELVKVKWPSTPVFEDFAFENADYMKTGAEVFRRRIGGDALALYGAMEEVLPTISHPDMKFETFMEHMEKAYGSLDTPFGFQFAQDLMHPFIRARFKFVGEYNWGRYMPVIDDLFNFVGIPLSRAQYYYGRKGEAIDGFALRSQIEELVGKGIVRRHKVEGETASQVEKLRAEVRASLFQIVNEKAPLGLLLVSLILLSQYVQRSLKER